MPDLSVIIVNFNTKDLVLECLGSIYENKLVVSFRVWVIDNGSTDGSVSAIKKNYPAVRVIENESNLGFAKANNLALRQMRSDYYLLLNSDTLVGEGALERLVEVAGRCGFGILSCKLVNQDGSFQPNAGELPYVWPLIYWLTGLDDVLGLRSYHANNPGYYADESEVGWVSGSVMLIERSVLEKVGYLDENIFMYAEDVDFCFRAHKKGFKIGWTDQAKVVHLGGGSLANSKLNQWRGEFLGLLYFYNKNFGFSRMVAAKVLFYVFILLRAIGFAIIGKPGFAKIYAQIFATI